MAITAYTGLPGSGKSYGVVEHVILPAIKAGRSVWTNVAVKMDVFDEKMPGHRLVRFDTDDVVNDPNWFQDVLEPGSVLVLDELWKIWKQGQKQSQAPEGHQSFLAEHRHIIGDDGQSTEVVFVTQDLGQLAAWSRMLISQTAIATKLTAIGAKNKFRVDFYQGAIKGQQGPASKLIQTTNGTYKPEVYQFYSTHTMSTTGATGTETKADKRGTIWQRPQIKYGAPAMLVVGLIGLYWVYGFFTGGMLAADESTAVADSPAGAPQAAPVASDTPPQDTEPRVYLDKPPALSDSRRLSGTIDTGGNGWALIVDQDNRTRRIPLSACDQFDDTGETYCDVSGERVTAFTGRPIKPSKTAAVGLSDAGAS